MIKLRMKKKIHLIMIVLIGRVLHGLLSENLAERPGLLKQSQQARLGNPSVFAN